MSVQSPVFDKAGSKLSKGAAMLEDTAGKAFDVKRFAENFDILTETEEGAPKLREMVLYLAVRGVLVPQDPTEGGGRDALNGCRRKRSVLLAAGEIRGAGPTAPVGSDEQPFSIPSSWVWTRLGELGDWGAGATPSRSNANYYGGATPWFKSGELTDSYVFDSEEHVTDLALRECSLRANRPGDVLMAMYGATIGKVAITRLASATNQAVCACTCFDGIDNEFLLRVLKATRRRFVEQGAGGAQPNISKIKIIETPCPLPPLAEQKRIVAKVDELMRLIADLEAKQTKKRETQARLRTAALDALTSAEGPEEFEAAWKMVAENFGVLFEGTEGLPLLRATILDLAARGRLCRRRQSGRSGRDLLAEITRERQRLLSAGSIREPKAVDQTLTERPFELPRNWEWARIGETFDVVGGLQKTPARAPTHRHYPYLRVENVQRGRLDLGRMERFEVSEQELARLRLQRGDLLVVEGNGSETEIGRCARWDSNIENCIHQNHIIRCRPFGPMSGDFTLLFLNSPSGIAEMKRLAITTSGLYSLSVGKVRGIAVPVPNEEEREETLANIQHLLKLCDNLEANLRRAEEIAAKLVEAVVSEMVA